QDAIVGADHVVVVDRPPDLLAAVVQEMRPAERRVVTPDVDHRRTATDAAFHVAPPEVTGRISMTSASANRASRVTSVSPWITSTDSALSSSRSRSAETVSGPRTSTSRRGLRSTTFTPSQATGRYLGCSRRVVLCFGRDRSNLQALAGFELGLVHDLRRLRD